ncbi:hypothetical protein AXG93_1231s1010 [Marchantia polymorpha subsp. ruderalis]|uniref:Uncharacterized protein n=1 Tax=Marchantia polymorpha subsp. ruderalis TaxID=1480154 RepID=A0A176VQ31_MARPO|nr:hypothetical protein AXG93_1231s1010 [Marchantia polymorpha subsp. ruderalis]
MPHLRAVMGVTGAAIIRSHHDCICRVRNSLHPHPPTFADCSGDDPVLLSCSDFTQSHPMQSLVTQNPMSLTLADHEVHWADNSIKVGSVAYATESAAAAAGLSCTAGYGEAEIASAVSQSVSQSVSLWVLMGSHGPATGSSTELIIQLQSASSPHPSAEPGWDPLRAALKTERGGHLSQSAFLRCTCMDVQIMIAQDEGGKRWRCVGSLMMDGRKEGRKEMDAQTLRHKMAR